MNLTAELSLRRAPKDRRGQALIFVTLWSTVVFGMAALVVDFGLVYFDQIELNNATQAAALAGAWAMSQGGATVTSTTDVVTTYSGTTGNANAYGNIPGVSIPSGYPAFPCLSTLKSVFGIQCHGPSNSNAIVVKQQVSVPLFFLRLFGSNSVTLTATATAAMRGASPSPFNVAIIVDSTQSMNSTDSDSNCNSTRINCALSGVQILLNNLSPCFVSEASCGAVTGGNVANSVDRVSLLTFPPVTTATAANDYNCASKAPTTAAYAYPLPAGSTYQLVNFSSDYRNSDSASSLNSSSNIVAAAGGKTGSPCLQAIGGYGTYYAQVIYAAQAYLVAEQSSYAASKNVMILLSDGDATASAAQMPGASTTSGTYMSSVQECHQAITAAAAAAAAGTRVYSVAYGAAASGCATDTSPTITPCQTMQQIASDPAYFFSDYTASKGSSSCISASQPITGLNQIFQAIAADLGVVKLIPNNTT
jgi:hypothetical protein